jgi:hypothetical protein
MGRPSRDSHVRPNQGSSCQLTANLRSNDRIRQQTQARRSSRSCGHGSSISSIKAVNGQAPFPRTGSAGQIPIMAILSQFAEAVTGGPRQTGRHTIKSCLQAQRRKYCCLNSRLPAGVPALACPSIRFRPAWQNMESGRRWRRHASRNPSATGQACLTHANACATMRARGWLSPPFG